MDSVQAFKVPYPLKTPANVQNDSGFGSMLRTFGDYSICEHDKYKSSCLFCTGTEKSKCPQIGRLKMLSVETVKKKLFPGSPYSPEESLKDSLINSEPRITSHHQYKKQRMMTKVTEDIKRLSFATTKPSCNLPKCPKSPQVKFYYSPLKNTKLFPPSSKSSSGEPVTKTNYVRNFKSWGSSLSLPEQCHDLLKKLADRDLNHLISSILSHLSDEDLCRASCVSSTWKHIVLSNSKARKRKENCVEKKLSLKENQMAATEVEIFRPGVVLGDRELLLDVTNRDIFKPSLPSKVPTPKSEQFLTIAKELGKAEVLLKCPMCQHPAKPLMDGKYHCTRSSCCYAFCKKCLGLHTSYACPTKTSFEADVIVGSKKSKRNLKRL